MPQKRGGRRSVAASDVRCVPSGHMDIPKECPRRTSVSQQDSKLVILSERRDSGAQSKDRGGGGGKGAAVTSGEYPLECPGDFPGNSLVLQRGPSTSWPATPGRFAQIDRVLEVRGLAEPLRQSSSLGTQMSHNLL